MPITSDFSIDYTNKRIYHSSGSTVYSVNALYSYIQDDFDELGQLDDTIPMSAQTPTAYTMINGWFIDDESVKYLNGGAIATSGWLNEIHIVQFGATYTSCVSGDIGKPVLDDGGAFGTLLAYDNTLKKWWVRTGSATTAASGSAMTITGGTGQGTSSATSTTGENLYTNIYTLGSIEAGTTIYIEQNGALITSWWSSGHIDVLIKVKEMGTEIDGANIYVFAREYTDLYDYFPIDLTAGGRQAVPLATTDDINNQTAVGTIVNYQNGVTATIAISFGSYSVDVNNDGTPENYKVQIDCNGQRLSYVYEVCKYWTRRGSAKSLNGVTGDLYLAADGSYTPLKPSPLGTYAGGKFFGARGVYLINLHPSDVQSYQLLDNTNTTVVPPNYVSVQVQGLSVGDRVAVYPASGGNVNKTQYTLTTIAGGAGTIVISTTIPSDTPTSGYIVAKKPSANAEYVYRYNSWTGSTFTLPTGVSGVATGGSTSTIVDSGANFLVDDIIVGDIVYQNDGTFGYVVSIDSGTQITTTLMATSWSGIAYNINKVVSSLSAADSAYVPYIYTTADATTETVTIIYVTDRSIVSRVRKKGILPFEVQGTITNTGATITAIRTTDSIVT